jgi:hypothetical protein
MLFDFFYNLNLKPSENQEKINLKMFISIFKT